MNKEQRHKKYILARTIAVMLIVTGVIVFVLGYLNII